MKVGVVGYGSIGSRHAANLVVLGHEVLVYDTALRRDVKFERNIYEQCDAVVIATPTMFHEQAIRACAEYGNHMLIEKPMARVSHGLRAVLDLAESNGSAIMMGNNLRFHPCVQQAKQWIDADAIGEPIWAHFICSQQQGRKYRDDGVILNTGAHEVDVALHLFGPASRVLWTNTLDDAVADFGLLHSNGARSSFHLDTVTPTEIREAWIVGDKERIGLELCNRQASLGHHTEAFSGNYDGDYFAEMEAFIKRIEGEDVPGATAADGLATLSLLLDVRKRAWLP